MITEKGNNPHWNLFLALDEDASNLSRYVEFSNANFKTYSIEMVRLLMAASSEVDVVAKILCKQIDIKNNAENINEYRNIIKPKFPGLINYQIIIPRFGLGLAPWKNWELDINPDWWRDYNLVKHTRNNNFEKANLSNTLNSIAGLFSMLLYCFRKEAGKGLLAPAPKLFGVHEEKKTNRVYIDSKAILNIYKVV